MKENVLIYRTTVDASKKLNDKQFREFFDKYFDYVLNDVPFETDDLVVDVLFTSIKVTLDKSLKNYQNCIKNGNKGAEYGKRGGRPRKEKTPTETPSVTPTETPRDNNTSDGYFDDNKPQEKPQEKPHNDNVDVNDNVNEDVDVNVDSGISTNNNTTHSEEKEDYDVDVTVDSSNQEEEKVEATGKIKLLLESFVDGDNTRFPTMDELRAIFIKDNIHFTDEDFKINSSGMSDGKYKLSPKNATMSVLKYLKPAIANHGYLCDSDNKDIQNAVISYISKKKLNVVIGNNY